MILVRFRLLSHDNVFIKGSKLPLMPHPRSTSNKTTGHSLNLRRGDLRTSGRLVIRFLTVEPRRPRNSQLKDDNLVYLHDFCRNLLGGLLRLMSLDDSISIQDWRWGERSWTSGCYQYFTFAKYVVLGGGSNSAWTCEYESISCRCQLMKFPHDPYWTLYPICLHWQCSKKKRLCPTCHPFFKNALYTILSMDQRTERQNL